MRLRSPAHCLQAQLVQPQKCQVNFGARDVDKAKVYQQVSLSHQMSLADQVLATLAEVAEFDELRTNLDVKLYETHVLDSLKTVELMLALSDRFGLEISPAEFDPELWATPAKIVQYVEGRMAA